MRKPLIGLLLVLCTVLSAVYSRDYRTTLNQPDGKSFEAIVNGDEYFRKVTDKDNYTLLVNPLDGYWTYAVKEGGELVPSFYRYGQVNPHSLGITPGLEFSREQIQARVGEMEAIYSRNDNARTPNTGTFNNLVVFIRFSGEAEFGQNISIYSNMISDNTAGANTLKNYFLEASYGQLTIDSYYYPTPSGSMVVSYQDSHPRGYYQPYSGSNTIGYNGDDQRTTREFDLLESACGYIASSVPTGLNIDADNDGYVDNVVFIVKGDTGAWSDLLWPHRWVLYDRTVNIRGKQVWDFNLQLQVHLVNSGAGVLCHEMFHSIGAPDLYHYSYDGYTPAGPWDLMEWNSNPPQHMTMYMKYRYGLWVSSIPSITTSGTYTLNPTTSSTNNVYKIASNDPSEFYVIEYRRESGTFENSLPGTGLITYRINADYDGEGNADGPPDELYIYRPNGTPTNDGNISSAVYNEAYGRTSITDYTSPNGFLSNGTPGGLNITNIGTGGETISFYVGIGEIGAPAINVSPTSVSASIPVDQTLTRTVRISNSGTAPLTYLLNLENSTRDSGGPSDAGYYWLDSDEANGPAYVWNSITSSGTEINYTSDDQMSSDLNLGFSFPFYSNNYTTVKVCNNGFLTFTDSDTEWDNEDIPNSSTPNNYIAPFWDDMSPQTSGSVHYYADSANQRFIVQFTDSPHYYTVQGTYTFQVHLYANGEIYFYYNNMQSTVNSATIGIENSTGSEGLKMAYNQTYVHNSLAVAIKNIYLGGDEVDWLDASTMTGTVNPGSYDDVVLTFNSTGLTSNNSFSANMVINSDDTANPTITIPVTMTTVGGFDAPANATASYVNGHLEIRWTPVNGATSYRVFMASSPTGTFVNRSTLGSFGTSGADITWTTTFLLNATTYDGLFFYITAVAD